MARRTTRVDGVRELQRSLRDLPGKLRRRAVDAALRDAMRPVLADAQAGAAVESGHMRDSIKMRATRSGVEVYIDEEDFEGYPYFAAAEFGTSKQAAEPFMTPAFQQNLPTIPARVAAGVRARFESLGD